MSEDNCNHKFIHYKEVSYWMEYGYRGYKFVSTQYFFCEKCLEEKEITKTHMCNQGEFERRPEWCKSINKKIYE